MSRGADLVERVLELLEDLPYEDDADVVSALRRCVELLEAVSDESASLRR